MSQLGRNPNTWKSSSKSGNQWAGRGFLVFFRKWEWVEGVNETNGAPTPITDSLGLSPVVESDQVPPGAWRLQVGPGQVSQSPRGLVGGPRPAPNLRGYRK